MKSLVVVLALLAMTGVRTLWAQSTSAARQPGKTAAISGAPITVGETLRVNSKRLGEERVIRVYLPSSYRESTQRYPVIYTLDGEVAGPVTADAVQFMANGSELPQMPEALVVAIPNTDRARDMPPPGDYGKGGEENFLAFLADDLIPMIEQRYRTQPLRVLVGHSQGGTFVHYALTARPTVFQWYLPLDAPLFGPLRPILEKARTLITKDPTYRGRLVTIENNYGWMKDWSSLTDAAPKGFYGARVEITDETHETMVYKGIYEGFKRLFYDYAPDIRDAKLAELEAKYNSFSESYGYRVDIPQRVLLRSASRNALQQNGAEALKLVQRAVALYGESATTKRIRAEAEEAVRQGGPDPKVAEILNSPPPGIEQMKPFLGTWAGRMDVPGGVPLDVVLTFEVEDGVVRAHEKMAGPGGKSFSVRITFIRVLEGDVLQWGGPNGRIGINIDTANLMDENTLKGTSGTIGVTRDPARTPPPDPTFTYKRQSVETNNRQKAQ